MGAVMTPSVCSAEDGRRVRAVPTKSQGPLRKKYGPVGGCSTTPIAEKQLHRHGPSAAAMTGLRPIVEVHGTWASCCSPFNQISKQTLGMLSLHQRAATYHDPHVVARPRAAGPPSSGGAQPAPGGLFPRPCPAISKIVAVRHPHQTAKGADEGRHPRQQPRALLRACLLL